MDGPLGMIPMTTYDDDNNIYNNNNNMGRISYARLQYNLGVRGPL